MEASTLNNSNIESPGLSYSNPTSLHLRHKSERSGGDSDSGVKVMLFSSNEPQGSSGTGVSNLSSSAPVVGSNSTPGIVPGNSTEGGGIWRRLCRCFYPVSSSSPSFFLACCCGKNAAKPLSGISFNCCFYHPENSRPRWLNRLHLLTKSVIWKTLFVIFSLFLLFGAPIQYLAVDETGENVFEVLRTIMLAFFVMDMGVRCATEPDYFVCTFCGGGSSSALGGLQVAGRHNLMYADSKDSTPCAVGSFLFWCDLISTLAILYDLSYVNPNANGVWSVDIGLNSEGVPISGIDVYDRLRPVDLEFDLLIVIARSARCARFVQHRAVVGVSNSNVWFWIVKYARLLNPFFYYHYYRRQHWQSRTQSTGNGGHEENFPSATSNLEVENTEKNSWGVLKSGILAAVHAKTEAEARDSQSPRASSSNSFWKYVKNGMQSVGLLSSEATLAKKEAAARKIQRAWRNYVKFESNMSVDGDFGDIGSLNNVDATNRSNRSDQKGRQRSSIASVSRSQPTKEGEAKKRAGRSRPSAPESRFQNQSGKGRESQVGSDMRELTGERVAIGTLFALVCSVLFTYTESSTTWATTMVMLHEQTMFTAYQTHALSAAVNTTVPELFKYQPVVGPDIDLSGEGKTLRDRDTLKITVSGVTGTSVGWFDYSSDTKQAAVVDIVATIFIIVFWFFGVTAFSGPVMLLVITPIERMVRLLGMLMLDPLGYQSTPRFKRFLSEEDDIIKNTRWTKEVLKGMETSFLMSTILRIGSLMKVGFGSAGVEIIRNNLQKGQKSKNSLILNSQGSTVSCIFLFCDIRQFTDATECLQEEVFVFTNKIAAVVHSICHSYGGAANKNVGDAFLLSWSLLDNTGESNSEGNALKAKSNQGDKALLSVIKICISLYYDKYYLEPLTEAARARLKAKIKNRHGPVVQMGFGLHAGKAVQGAIGSPRKIDATYVSEAVERAEFLEASTKQYSLQLLMSGSFHSLLHPNTKRRCRLIDKVFIVDEDEDADEDDEELSGERMDIYTFDMDVEAIHRPMARNAKTIGENDTQTLSDAGSMSGDPTRLMRSSKRGERRSHGRQVRNRRRSTMSRSSAIGSLNAVGSEEFNLAGVGGNPTVENAPTQGSVSSMHSDEYTPNMQGTTDLVLPTGPALYSHNVWQSPDMKKIRDKFVQGLFFQKYNEGLHAYYNRDWETAQLCFQRLVENFGDGPSKYFLNQIIRNKGVPPKDFRAFGIV